MSAAKVCRWWWDEEGEDFLTSCRTVAGAQRRRCGNCGEAVKVVKNRDDLEAPESQPHTVHPWDALRNRIIEIRDFGNLSYKDADSLLALLPLGVRP